MNIENNHVVALQFELKNEKGEVLDASTLEEPLVYLHGAENIVPGLEQQLTGKAVGDKLDVILEPAEAYGEYDENLVQTYPLDAFEGINEVGGLKPGMELEAEDEDGGVFLFVVKEVNDDSVVVDGNHPLAGMKLFFKVEVEDIRAASNEEIDHGHVHQPGHHHH